MDSLDAFPLIPFGSLSLILFSSKVKKIKLNWYKQEWWNITCQYMYLDFAAV